MSVVRRRRVIKSGVLQPVSFSGTPKVASVVFASSYGTIYAVTIDVESTGGKTYAPTVESVGPAGFIINLCAGSLAGVVSVSWQAVSEGE